MSRTAGMRCVVSLALGLAWAPGAVSAADGELRSFTVTVDGKPAGTFKMAIRQEDGGKETIAVVADVKVRAAFLTYTYSLQSLEVWKEGRLVSVEANANNDGKKTAVRVTPAADGLAVTVNGRSRTIGADVLTTTGWSHPALAKGPAGAALLDTEDGTVTPVRLEPLAAAQVAHGGRTIESQRIRVTGKDVNAVWWFDGAGRPVRQEMTWDGHKVVLELTAIGR